MPTLCIAGKGSLAVDILKFVLAEHLVARDELRVLCSANDDGTDGFQPSLRRHCRAAAIAEATQPELAVIEDLVVLSLQYDRILRVSNWATNHFYNVHYSLLPKYRGMYPVAWAMLNGETSTGVTLHEIDSGIDTGPTIASTVVPIEPNDTCRDLYIRCTDAARELAKTALPSLIDGSVTSSEQPASGATYYGKGSIDFGRHEFDMRVTAFQLQRQINCRAFKEYQTPRVLGFGVQRAIVCGNRSVQRPGSVVRNTDGELEVCTLDYNVILLKDCG